MSTGRSEFGFRGGTLRFQELFEVMKEIIDVRPCRAGTWDPSPIKSLRTWGATTFPCMMFCNTKNEKYTEDPQATTMAFVNHCLQIWGPTPDFYRNRGAMKPSTLRTFTEMGTY